MPAPANSDDFLDLVRKSGLIDVAKLRAYLGQSKLPGAPAECSTHLVRDGLLTNFQAQQLLTGKYMGFSLGRYRVLEPIGSGAMSAVYLCRDQEKGRVVAVKVLPKALAKDPTLLKRFYREARASIELTHPNIVRGYEIENERDLHYFIMEYIDGVGLHDLVAKHGPLPVPRACHYIRQAAAGLQYAHEKGLVHRDIKPGNFLVDRAGTVKVLDLGLSRFTNEDDEILTRDVVGTIEFLAPEQARDSHDVDPRADIYGLGGTFYYLLAGQPPFSNEAFDPKDLKSRRPKPLSRFRHDVPPTLVEIIEKMMEPAPEQRYGTMAEVVQALTAFTQTPIPPPTDAEIPKPGEFLKQVSAAAAAAPRQQRRRRWLMAGLLAAACVGVLVVWLALR